MGVGSELRQFRAQQLSFGGGWLRFRAVLIQIWLAAWGLATFRGCFAPDMACCMGVGSEKRQSRAQWPLFGGGWLRFKAFSQPVASYWQGLATFRVFFAPEGYYWGGAGDEKRGWRSKWMNGWWCEGRREKGEGRREKGEGRREKARVYKEIKKAGVPKDACFLYAKRQL